MSVKDEVIAEQQVMIRKLSRRLMRKERIINKIEMVLYCVGGPLNDNRQSLSKEQLADFFSIARILKTGGES